MVRVRFEQSHWRLFLRIIGAAGALSVLGACSAGDSRPSKVSQTTIAATGSGRTSESTLGASIATLTIDPSRICIRGSQGAVTNYCVSDTVARRFISTDNGGLVFGVTGKLDYGEHASYNWFGNVQCIAAPPGATSQDEHAGKNLTVFSFDDGRLEVAPDAPECGDGTKITPTITNELQHRFSVSTAP